MLTKQKALRVLTAALGAIIMIGLFGQGKYSIDAFQIQVKIAFTNFGYSEFSIPPFGAIRAQTHIAPLGLFVTLLGVDLEGLQRLILSGFTQVEIYERFSRPLRVIILHFIGRFLLAAASGGGIAVLAIGFRSFRHFTKGLLTGFLVGILLLSLTIATLTPENFISPEYRGMLEAAPWMVALAKEALVGVETLGEQVQLMSTNLYYLLRQVEELGQLEFEQSDIKILHVSDIHNNPVALDLVEQVINTFAVDLVIDTGDLTDFGSPLETALLTRLDNFTVPYLITLGNHDSSTVARHLEDITSVTLLQGEIIEAAGCKIMGFPDPAAQRTTMAPADSEEISKAQDEIQDALAFSEKPDILAVHDYRLVSNLVGKIPVILHGHTHHLEIKKEEGTVIIGAGTTGAAGIRGLQTTEEIPFTLVLLHFVRTAEGVRLNAADTIMFFYREAGFEFNRTLFPK